MKIERKTSASGAARTQREHGHLRAGVNEDFLSLLSEQQLQIDHDEIDRMLMHVAHLGDALVFSQSIRAVEAYRIAVKKLVDHIVKNGLAVKNEALSDSRGRRKLYAILEEVDRHLLTLLQHALHNQLEPLEIHSIVGEVKGLLITLHS